jgi:hypothetical protein
MGMKKKAPAKKKAALRKKPVAKTKPQAKNAAPRKRKKAAFRPRVEFDSGRRREAHDPPTPPKTWIIHITPDPFPKRLPTQAGDKVIWQNDTNSTIDTFDLPTCVSPKKNPAPILPHWPTDPYTINKGSKGSYPYSYTDKFEDTRNGTIDVG